MEYGLCPFVGHTPYSFLLAIILLITTVDVNSQTDTTSLNCYGSINISLNNTTGQSYLDPGMFVARNSLNHLILRVNTTNKNYVDCSYKGEKIKIHVIDTSRNLSCWSELFVEDKSSFEMNCRDTIIDCISDLSLILPAHLITINDNCTQLSDLIILKSDSTVKYPNLLSDTLKIVYRKWSAEDINGDRRSCISRIYIRTQNLASIVFPKDTVIFCDDDHTNINITGDLIPPSGILSSRCMLGVQGVILDTLSFGCALKTKYIKKWTVIDWDRNMMVMDTQYIIRNDTSTIKIIAPEPILVKMDSTCIPYVVIPPAVIMSQCANIPQAELRVNINGLDRMVGDTVKFSSYGTFLAIYKFGSGSCVIKYIRDTVKITVNDTQKPLFQCASFGVPVLGLDSLVSRPIHMDSLFKNLAVTSCTPVSYFAKKVNLECAGDSSKFKKNLRFCNAEVCDTVFLDVYAINAYGISSDTCRVGLYIQDKISPVLTCRDSVIRFDMSAMITLDTAVLLALWGDNKAITSLTMTGSGLTMAGSGTGISTGSGISFLGTGGFITFNCQDTGQYIVSILATDATGNSNSCMSTLTILTGDSCISTSPRFSAKFLAYEKVPMAGVEISIETTGEREYFYSDSYGNVLSDELNNTLKYKIRTRYKDDWRNGIDVFDLYRIQAHILGLNQLTSPIDMISADVNESNKIDVFDLIDTRKIILGKDMEMTDNHEPWRFYLKNETRELIKLQDILEIDPDQMLRHYEVISIKKGDVNGSALTGASIRGFNSVMVAYHPTSPSTGEFELSMKEYQAMQIGLEFDDGVKPISVNSSTIDVELDRNSLILLDYKIKDGAHANTKIRISVKHTWGSKMSANRLKMRKDFESKSFDDYGNSRELFLENQSKSIGITEFLIVPNPSDGRAKIILPQNLSANVAGNLEFGLFDLSGKKVLGRDWKGKIHLQEIFPIEIPENLHSGLYIVRIRLDDEMINNTYIKL